MKNFKRTVALLIVLVMTVSMLPLAAFATENISFGFDSITVAVGSSVRFEVDEYTGNASYSSSDDSVIKFDNEGYRVGEVMGAGTATVTATDEDGFSATIEVTAVAADEIASEITLDQPSDVLVSDNGGYKVFSFTAPETARYAFFSFEADKDTYGYLYDSEMKQIDYDDDSYTDRNFCIEAELEQGETVYLVGQLYATFSETRGAYKVQVTKMVQAESMVIVNTQTEYYVGEYMWISVEYGPEFSTYEGITVSSDNEEVAEVSGTQVRFVGEGTATVTATSENGLTDTITFNVTVRPELEGIEIVNVDNSTAYVGTADDIDVTAMPADALIGNIQWSTSDESVATVSDTGNVEFIGVGEVTITATSDLGFSDSYTFNVIEHPVAESITITNINSENAYVGDEDWLEYYFSPSDAVDESVEWSSDDENIATVDQEGWVTFVGEGTVTITVTSENGLTDSVVFTVTERLKPEEIVIDDGEEITIFVGETKGISVSFVPEDAQWMEPTGVSDNPDVATISSNGIITGISAGTATITITTENGLSDTIIVNVLDTTVIEVDQTYVVNNETNGMGMFKFVPEKTGHYGFFSFDNNYDTYGYLYDENMEELKHSDDDGEDLNFRIDYELIAGKTYYYKARPYNENNGSKSKGYSVKLIELVPATSMEFSHNVVNVYLDSYYYFNLKFGPENAIKEPVDWEVEDENIAYVYIDESGEVEIEGYEIGTTTVTAYTDSGFEATLTINVIPYKEVKLNQKVEVDFDYYYYKHYYTFTPQASREYYFDLIDGDFYIDLEDENGNNVEDIHNSEYVSLEEGVTYVLKVRDDSYDFRDASFVITESAFKNVELLNAPTKEYILCEGIFVSEEEDGLFAVYPADLEGIQLKVTYYDGRTEILTKEDGKTFMLRLGNFDYGVDTFLADGAGTYETTLYLGEYEFTYDVTVVENKVAEVELVKGPKLSQYYEYFYPRYDGIQLLVTYIDGTSETITLTQDMINYEFGLGVMGMVELDGIEILITINVGSRPLSARSMYNPDSMLMCNGIIVDLTNEISYDDEVYPVDFVVKRFSETGDGMIVEVEFSDGSFRTITLDMLLDLEPGNYVYGFALTELGIVEVEIYGSEDTAYVYMFDAEFYVSEEEMYTSGDINNDGKLNGADYMMLKAIILGNKNIDDLADPVTAFNRCDYNGDGKHSIADYMMLKKYILG